MNVISVEAIYTNNKVIQKWVTYPFISTRQPSYIWTTVILYSICNELHARWGHLTYTHCVPGVMNSMCAGFSCAGFHVRRAPCLPGSCAQGYTLARFHAYRVPCLPGSMLTGFQLRWVPCTPGSICCQFLCVLFLCVVNSMLVGFHARRVPCMLGYKYMLLVKVISIAGDIY